MLNNCKVYKATKLETFCSKYLPYYLPFINKRRRVKIKWYFKYAFRRRLMNDMVNLLKDAELKYQPKESNIDIDLNFEWEVINNFK